MNQANHDGGPETGHGESPLKGQVALVTGGTHGIGRAVCQAFLSRGAVVHACGRDPEETGALRRSGIAATRVDIRDADQVSTWVDEAEKAHGRLDVLVNAAGVSLPEVLNLEHIEPDQWDRIIVTNLSGTYYVCRAVLPHMKRAGSGHIVNVLSKGAYRVSPGSAPYIASKYGARALTEALIEETKGTGITVSSVSPGPVDTNIWSHKRRPPSTEERSRMLRPEDVADAVLFICERPRHVHIESVIVLPLA